MRLPLVRVAVVAAASLFALQATAQNAGNPIQVALLRWYAANTAAQISSCHAQGIAFDGAHIWVGCPIANTVQEFNASDGTKINTVFLGTSVSPSFLVYDGANIWTSNTNGTLTEVNASTATVVRTVSVGSNPLGMTFDGTNIWVANSGSDSVSIVQATTGSVTTSATFTNCNVPYGAIFDGTHVWLSCHNDNTIAELNPMGNIIGTPTPAGFYPTYMAYDGINIWVANTTGAGTVTEIQVSTGTTVRTVSVGAYPEGTAFDTMYIWVLNNQAGSVTKILASSGVVIGTYPIASGSSLSSVGFDGGNIWVLDTAAALLHKM